ncbi:MAG: hypothetical protein EOO45_09500 [Flavobacterium sp.]|nr:MAG: hypothetical protein EOO45_09500 [Flavobacterium sp.]
MIKTLFNPFERYSEIALFAFGMLMALAGAYAAYYFDSRFDGVIDYSVTLGTTLPQALLDNVINTLSLFIFVFILAKFVNRKTRIIDILNTALISRIPFYILPFFNAAHTLSDVESRVMKSYPTTPDFSILEISVLMGVAFAAIGAIVWFIVLIYQGFKVASNSKENIHKLYLAIAVIAAEVLSKILIYITA